jgi:ubiquinone/menaquinone biosynthesis C-methylase UbiE
MTSSQSLDEIQAFFSPRAAGWEDRFPNDALQFTRAVQELSLAKGATVLDLGCGTGRALLPLREAVGATGRVVGLDATMAMLGEAQRLGRTQIGYLLQGDVNILPFANAIADAIFASGLLPHLTNPIEGLAEMARVTVSGGKLAIFHPLSRKALAARHHRVPTDDDVLAKVRLENLLTASGWQLVSVDDADDRFLAMAVKK